MRTVIKFQLLNMAQGQKNGSPRKTGKVKNSPVPKGLRCPTQFQSGGPGLAEPNREHDFKWDRPGA